MPDSPDPIAQKFLDVAADPATVGEELAANIKALKAYAEAKKLLEPEPEPVPEPTGFKAFLVRNSGDLIKAGTTLAAVVTIAVIEAKGDVIFRSKGTKFI